MQPGEYIWSNKNGFNGSQYYACFDNISCNDILSEHLHNNDNFGDVIYPRKHYWVEREEDGMEMETDYREGEKKNCANAKVVLNVVCMPLVFYFLLLSIATVFTHLFNFTQEYRWHVTIYMLCTATSAHQSYAPKCRHSFFWEDFSKKKDIY